jgi:hypothetical protein
LPEFDLAVPAPTEAHARASQAMLRRQLQPWGCCTFGSVEADGEGRWTVARVVVRAPDLMDGLVGFCEEHGIELVDPATRRRLDTSRYAGLGPRLPWV